MEAAGDERHLRWRCESDKSSSTLAREAPGGEARQRSRDREDRGVKACGLEGWRDLTLFRPRRRHDRLGARWSGYSDCMGLCRRKRSLLFAVLGFYVVATLIARRRGYRMGGNVVVRCRQGHLFTTIWVPGASLKSIRLGWWRLQRCPVGMHWSIVSPVKEANLTEDERRSASEHKDIRIP